MRAAPSLRKAFRYNWVSIDPQNSLTRLSIGGCILQVAPDVNNNYREKEKSLSRGLIKIWKQVWITDHINKRTADQSAMTRLSASASMIITRTGWSIHPRMVGRVDDVERYLLARREDGFMWLSGLDRCSRFRRANSASRVPY